MTFRGYGGGGGPPSASSSYFGSHGPGDERKSTASNVAGGFRPSGYSDAREQDLVRGSGQENWSQSSYSSFKRSEDMLRVTVGNSLYLPPGSGGSTEVDNGASSWGRGGGSAQFERTVESLGSLPGMRNDACNNQWNVPQPDFRQRNRAPVASEGNMHMADSGVDDKWSGRAEAAASRSDLTRRGGPVPPAHSRGSEREIGASHAARNDTSVSGGFTAGRTSDFGGQRDSVSAAWRSADTGLYAQQSVAADHLGSGAGLSAPKSILKSKPFGQSAMPAVAAERMIPSAVGSDGLSHHHVGSAAPDGSSARAALQAQSLLVAAAAAAASSASSGGSSGSSSMPARAQVFDYGHSKPDVLFGNKATVPQSDLQGGPSSTGPSASVGVTDGAGQTAAGRDLMQDPLFDSIIKSMGVDFDPKKKLQERARELEQQVEEAARRKRREKTEEEIARQFGINKTASFLEGGDLDIGTVLGSSAALVTAAVRRSTDNDARAAASHHRRHSAQSSVPEPCAANAASIRDSHPDQESGKSRRGGASPSRKSHVESDAGGGVVHVRDGRSSSDIGRSGGVGDRYDARLAGSSQRETGAGYSSERSPSGAQSSHYASRSSAARDVTTEFASSVSSEEQHDRRSGRDMTDRRPLSDSRQASEAASQRTKGDRSIRSDAIDVDAQCHRRDSSSSSGSSTRVPTPGGGRTSETPSSTGVLTREEHEQLKLEMEDRRRRLRLLEGELEKLRRQQNELLRKNQQRGGGVGRRDPFIDENTRLQEDISKQIAQLRKTAEANERALAARLALSESASNAGSASTKSAVGRSDASAVMHAGGGSSESGGSGKSASSRNGRDSHANDDVIERLSSHFNHDQAKALSAALGDSSAATALFRALLQFHPSLGETAAPTLQQKQPQSFEDRSASKSSSTTLPSAGVDGGIGRQPSRSAAPRPSPPTEGAVYEYYDSSAHWCKPCNVELPTLSGLLEHLAADSHQQALEQPERPWAASALQRAPAPSSKSAKKESATIIKLPLKGSEFIVPASHAFYCRLCSSFAGDQRCMEAHIKSGEHYESYKKYTSDNPFYERRYTLDREASARMRKRRQEEDARLADRAKRQRLDDELVNKKLEALKTRHRQTLGDAACSTTAKPDVAATESVREAAAKQSATTESLTPDSADGCGSKTQRLDLQVVIKKESSGVAKSPLVDAAEPREPLRDGVSTSKKMRLDDVGSNEATAAPSTKERQSAAAVSAEPSTERGGEAAAGSALVAVDVGRPISVVVGKKSVTSTASAATQGAATHVASAAAAAAATLAGATAGVANAPLAVASGTDRQPKSSQQTRSIQSSAAVTVDRTATASASTKPATGSAQPGGLSASGTPQGPVSRGTTQTTKAAGALISPSSKRAAATPTAATSAAAAITVETGSKSSSASIGATAASGSRQGAAAAVPAIPAAKAVGKLSGVPATRSPVAGSVRPAAAVSSQPGSSVGTSPVTTATGAASPKPPGPAAGFSQPQSGDKAIAASGVCNAPASKSLPAPASKQSAPGTTSGAARQQQQSRPSQQHQTRSATAATVGTSASVAGGGKPAGGIEAISGIGSSLAAAAAAARPSTASPAATSLPAPPPAAQQAPAAKSVPSPPDSSTGHVPEASPAISQTTKDTAPGSIAASQPEVDSKPGIPAAASSSAGSATTESAALSRATASAMLAADKTGSSKAPSRPSPSPASGAESGNAAASGVGRGRQETSAKVSRPAASTATTTTTAAQPSTAKPAAATSASAKPPPAAAKGQSAAGGEGTAAPVSAADVAATTGGTSNRPGATAVAAVAPADRTRAQRPAAAATAARPAAAASSSASAGKSASQLPAAERPAADVPPRASGGAGHSTRLSSSPATRKAAGNASRAAMPTGSAQAVSSAAVAVKPASAASIDDVAAAKVAVVKPAGAVVSSATSADASDLEGDGSVSGADEGSADDLSMDGDFEILDEYEEHEEHA